MYQIKLERRVTKELDKLSQIDRQRILASLLILPKNPRGYGKKIKKLVGVKNGYRLRVGTLRVLYVIDDKNKLVKIYRAGKRGGVY